MRRTTCLANLATHGSRDGDPASPGRTLPAHRPLGGVPVPGGGDEVDALAVAPVQAGPPDKLDRFHGATPKKCVPLASAT